MARDFSLTLSYPFTYKFKKLQWDWSYTLVRIPSVKGPVFRKSVSPGNPSCLAGRSQIHVSKLISKKEIRESLLEKNLFHFILLTARLIWKISRNRKYGKMIKRRCRNPNHAKEHRKSTTTKHNFVGMILTGFLQKI